MTANPLRNTAQTVKRTPHEWCDRGNQLLAEMGRNDVHWIVRDGRVAIEWKCRPITSN